MSNAAVLQRHLHASLQLLAAESPQHWTRLRAQLADSRVHVRIGADAPFELNVTGSKPSLRAASGNCDIELALSEDAVSAFLHGSLTLEPALRSGALQLRGSLTHITRLLGAFDAWLHGLLRAPSSAELYRELCQAWPPTQSISRDNP